MKQPLTLLSFLVTTTVFSQELPYQPQIWPSEPPADCPFPKSQELTGVAFTGSICDNLMVKDTGWF